MFIPWSIILLTQKYQNRPAIAEALGIIGDYAAVRPLIETADKEEGILQQFAIIALGEILIRSKYQDQEEFDAEAITNVLNRIIRTTTNQQVYCEARRILQRTNP